MPVPPSATNSAMIEMTIDGVTRFINPPLRGCPLRSEPTTVARRDQPTLSEARSWEALPRAGVAIRTPGR
jgi:hypothetical protein